MTSWPDHLPSGNQKRWVLPYCSRVREGQGQQNGSKRIRPNQVLTHCEPRLCNHTYYSTHSLTPFIGVRRFVGCGRTHRVCDELPEPLSRAGSGAAPTSISRRTLRLARWTSRRKYVRPTTSASVEPVKRIPSSHFSGSSSSVSANNTTITMQTSSAANVQLTMAMLARRRRRSS